jgi:isoquinoline 1-oxidoreductase beta subunit
MGETGFQPNFWVHITPDNKVQILCHRSEMGQWARTSVPMLVAEELAVDLNQIELIQAQGDAKYGDQNTDGSTTIRKNWESLRLSGAAAREMLEKAAATAWNVSASEVRAEKGKILHPASGRSLSYGELCLRAATLPVPQAPRLRDPSAYTIVGKPQKPIDLKNIITGKAIYGMDVVVPDMVYASVERCPTIYGKLVSFDASEALKFPGVIKVFEIAALPQEVNTNAGVAVVATNTWAAFEGRKRLKIQWDHGSVPVDSSAKLDAWMRSALDKSGTVYRSEGNFEEAKSRASKVLEATYSAPFLVHATMEPLVATAKVDSHSCEIWAPTQDPQRLRRVAANYLGLAIERVAVNVTLLGGGFGRKSQPDFGMEAVEIAKVVGKPVKAVWTREDEVRHGFYHAQSMQTLEACLDSSRQLTGWRHRSAFPTIMRVFNAAAAELGEFEITQGATQIPYRIPHVQIEGICAPSPVRVGWLRSVCHVFHSFAINSFVDELAHSLEEDPVDLRLRLMGERRVLEYSKGEKSGPFKEDTQRLAHVIELVRKKSGWPHASTHGRHLGFASHYSFFSYVATVAEVSVHQGKTRVHKVHCAVDCGRIVNPDGVRQQVEGGINFGASIALHGKVTVQDGVVDQGNFDTYPVVRMKEAPEIFVYLVDSTADPSGVGEPPTPPVAPAIYNAVFAATGKRLRQLPLA